MLDTSRWLLDLCALGLTQYEAKVYLALMQRRFFTAAEVARVSTVPRQRIYDVLSSLFERGLVRVKQGGSMQYTAIDPQQAMDRLIAERRQALEGLERTTVELLAALAPKWSDGQAEADPLTFVELIRDQRTVVDRLAELQRGARQRLLVLARPPFAVLDSSAPSVRCVYEPAEDLTIPDGSEARVAPSLPIGLCIVDDSRALLGLRDPVAGSASTTHVLIEHAELARFLALAFESVWLRASPLR